VDVPQLELVCFTTVRLIRYVLTPTDRPSTPFNSTELAAIFGGILTVATWSIYDSNRR